MTTSSGNNDYVRMTTSSGRRRISWLFVKGAYGVFDDVRSSRTFVQDDSEPRVWCHDKRWRLRFVVAQTAQLRINFKVVPKSDASWGQSPLQRNRFQSPTTPPRDHAPEEADHPRRSCLMSTRMGSCLATAGPYARHRCD